MPAWIAYLSRWLCFFQAILTLYVDAQSGVGSFQQSEASLFSSNTLKSGEEGTANGRRMRKAFAKKIGGGAEANGSCEENTKPTTRPPHAVSGAEWKTTTRPPHDVSGARWEKENLQANERDEEEGIMLDTKRCNLVKLPKHDDGSMGYDGGGFDDEGGWLLDAAGGVDGGLEQCASGGTSGDSGTPRCSVRPECAASRALRRTVRPTQLIFGQTIIRKFDRDECHRALLSLLDLLTDSRTPQNAGTDTRKQVTCHLALLDSTDRYAGGLNMDEKGQVHGQSNVGRCLLKKPGLKPFDVLNLALHECAVDPPVTQDQTGRRSHIACGCRKTLTCMLLFEKARRVHLKEFVLKTVPKCRQGCPPP